MNYTEIPLSVSDYFRRSAGNPSLANANVYYEVDPTSEGGASLIRRPGIRKLATVGSGPIRAIYYRPDAFDNAFFVVSGNKAYRVERTGEATFSSIPLEGFLLSTGDVSVTSSSSTLFITDGTNLAYTDGVAPLLRIETPDLRSLSKLVYISGYVLCVVKNSQRFYWIEPGEITIDPLDFAEAEGLPDNIVDVLVLGDQIYFFGKETVEVWFLSGDATAPFQRIQGKLISIGSAGCSCVVDNSDTFFFIAADGTARMGPNAQRVSDSGVEERIRRALTNQNVADI